MSDFWKYVILVIIGYACGNFNFARILSKLRKNKITDSGSGNPGTMNMLRTHGALLAATTLFFDALKAAVPALIGFLWLGNGEYFSTESMIPMLTGGVSAVVGHIFPVVYKFKGGKGIASTFGLFMMLNPIPGVIIFVVSFVAFYFIKIGSVASFMFIYSFAIWHTIMPETRASWIALVLIWGIVALDTYAHRENIKRLLTNSERITSFKEGVQKDIQRIRDKKAEKLENFEPKEEEIKDKYQRKIDKTEEKLQRKIEKETEKLNLECEKKLDRHSKKHDKLAERLNKKEDKLIKKDDKYSAKLEVIALKSKNKKVVKIRSKKKSKKLSSKKQEGLENN